MSKKLKTKVFTQYTRSGEFFSDDGWRIVADPIDPEKPDLRQIWRLISPTGKEYARAFSPYSITPLVFDVEVISYHRLHNQRTIVEEPTSWFGDLFKGFTAA